MHGPIGFQRYWIEKQGYGGQSRLLLLVEKARERDIDVCAITSEEFSIEKETVDDRLWAMCQDPKGSVKPEDTGWRRDSLGSNVLVMEKDGRPIYFVNGQTVIVMDNGKRYDHLVVGSNQVPNQMSLEDTLSFCEDHGLIQIAEHPLVESHFGIGENILLGSLNRYDAVEGHNAQLALPSWLKRVPLVGQYSRVANFEAQRFAKEHNKPWIATSDAHRIEDLGIAYIDIGIDLSSEESLLASLKANIGSGDFTNHEGYIPLRGLLDWYIKFRKGVLFHDFDKNN